MAKFGFNLGAYVYQSGITTLAKSYLTTEAALEAEIAQAAKAVEDYDLWLETNKQSAFERDEDGFAEDDQSPLLNHQLENAVDAMDIMRKAFAVTIYHYWERWSQRWWDRHKSHAKLITTLENKASYPVHPGMQHFHWLVNILKHNRPDEAPQLLEERRDLFLPWTSKSANPDWELCVRLSGAHIAEFLEIISKSAPNGETPDIRKAELPSERGP